MLDAHGLDTNDWWVVKDTSRELTVRNKTSGETQILCKG